jgi:predicted TIM-barrel fold metal-dependent hydrolase
VNRTVAASVVSVVYALARPRRRDAVTESVTAPSAQPAAALSLIDVDIHVNVPKVDVLFPYVTSHWHEYLTQSAFRGPTDTPYPKGMRTNARPGSAVPGGGAAGTDLATTRAQALDAAGVDLGILTCSYGVESVHNPDSAAMIASAVNDWIAEEWLAKEPRLRGSIVVPSQEPEMAAKEIDRVASKYKGFVQVYLPIRSRILYGGRHFHPIYDAANRHGLAIALHFGGAPGNAPTPTGWPSYYIEEYAGMAQVCQSQIMNIIAEGVFDRFPATRMAILECGWAWVPGWMWRMDKEWKGLRREIPWVRELPSEYMRRHMRWSLQPIDVPSAHEFASIVEEMGSEDLIMHASDYPHFHSEVEAGAFFADLPPSLTRKIRLENARAFYRL